MSVVIRLTRGGRRHLPFYHIGVFDTRTRRDGRPIEKLGFYDPTNKDEEVRIDVERAKYWIGVGAKPSETMATILRSQGLTANDWKGKITNSKPKVSKAAKNAEADKARSVKKRTKKRTANSKSRMEKKKA